MQKQTLNVGVRFNLLTNILLFFFLFVLLLHISEAEKIQYNYYNINYNYNYYTLTNKAHTNKSNTNKTNTNKTNTNKTITNKTITNKTNTNKTNTNKTITNKTNTDKTNTDKTKGDNLPTLFFLIFNSKNSREKWKRKENINSSVVQLGAKKKNQKEIKRRKNYQYAIKHMFDKNGRRIKDINKERKSLKKKKIFDYEGFKVDKIFFCLSEEEMEELRDEELKRKSGEILYNNKYIDTYGVESDGDMEGM